MLSQNNQLDYCPNAWSLCYFSLSPLANYCICVTDCFSLNATTAVPHYLLLHHCLSHLTDFALHFPHSTFSFPFPFILRIAAHFFLNLKYEIKSDGYIELILVSQGSHGSQGSDRALGHLVYLGI